MSERIAIVNVDRCQPKRCNKECRKFCPVVKIGKECVTILEKSNISEELCIGCGICVKVCPFQAIQIINLPKSLSNEVVHRYGKNMFKLHRLPIPSPGKVVGITGANGVGKSTAIKILSNKLKPNFGKDQIDTKEIISHYRGSTFYNYLTKLYHDELKVVIKPQHIDFISKKYPSKRVKELISEKIIIEKLELDHILNRTLDQISGGELQRVICGSILTKKADVYIFDEPSSLLDVHQRLVLAGLIRGLISPNTYVIVVEHDLALLDFLSDQIHILYGKSGAYGISSLPFNVRDGLNIYLDGFIPTENMRFRDYSLNFNKPIIDLDEIIDNTHRYQYVSDELKYEGFNLEIESGYFKDSEITCVLGRNGIGKTTFLNHIVSEKKWSTSYKPQKILFKFEGLVEELFSMVDSNFKEEIFIPLQLDQIWENKVNKLSGGELQRVSLALALSRKADLYILDEPSAFLDTEQRIGLSLLLKRFVLKHKKIMIVVEHDLMLVSHLADRIINIEGIPAVRGIVREPKSLQNGLNQFLKSMNITIRKDPVTNRPRINKSGSQMDQEQKSSGRYF